MHLLYNFQLCIITVQCMLNLPDRLQLSLSDIGNFTVIIKYLNSFPMHLDDTIPTRKPSPDDIVLKLVDKTTITDNQLQLI